MSKSQASESPDPHVVTEDDGYTLTRYIAGVPRMYGSLRFTYRPVGSIARARFRDKERDYETEESKIRRGCKAAATRIVSWSAVDRKGQPLEISEKGVLSLHPMLQLLLLNVIVYSISGGDEDPESNVRQDPEVEDDPFGGVSTDDEVVAESRKN